jgi:hypothetical protein
MFARFSTLLLAAVLASPALWQAFVIGDLDVSTALLRYLIAVLVAAAMLALFRMLVRAYHEAQARHHEEQEYQRRRAEDQPGAKTTD